MWVSHPLQVSFILCPKFVPLNLQPKNDMAFLLDGLQEYRGILSTFPDTLMLHKVSRKVFTPLMKIKSLQDPLMVGK